MVKGTVLWFDRKKGYGFIKPNESDKPDIFVHQSDIQGDGFRSLDSGMEVEYQMGKIGDKPKAINITAPGGGELQPLPRTGGKGGRGEGESGKGSEGGKGNEGGKGGRGGGKGRGKGKGEGIRQQPREVVGRAFAGGSKQKDKEAKPATNGATETKPSEEKKADSKPAAAIPPTSAPAAEVKPADLDAIAKLIADKKKFVKDKIDTKNEPAPTVLANWLRNFVAELEKLNAKNASKDVKSHIAETFKTINWDVKVNAAIKGSAPPNTTAIFGMLEKMEQLPK